MEQKKAQILESFLSNAVFDGLNDRVLENCAKQAGISQGELLILAPDLTLSMIDYWFSLADEHMEAALKAREGIKIREKATLAIRARLEYFLEHKEALRKALAVLALPTNASLGLAIGYRMANKAWRAFGDKSTDFNYYTKRSMLLAVDIATTTFFLGDDSEEYEETWAFLDRRIENIMQIEKAKAGLKGLFANIPDPIPTLARLRYGKRPMP